MQSVKLNLIPGAVLPVVNVSQYDVKRTFQLAVYDGAASYDLTGKTVTIRGTKPDNHGFDYGTTDGVVSVSGNTVTISTTQQMTAVGGHVMAELRIESGTTVIGTLNFIIDVEPSALSDETIISDTEIPVIERDFEAALAEAEADALVAEGYAKGTQDGAPVGSGSPYYHNNAEHFKDEAEAAASGVLEKYPKIVSDYWYIWDVDTNQYVNTGVRAKGTQGDPGEGVPAGGTTGQVLKKKSNSDYDTEWGAGGGGASSLDDLTDVTITTPASGQGLLYDGAEWVNADVIVPDELTDELRDAEVIEGKNLLPNNTVDRSYLVGVSFKKNQDGSETINGTTTYLIAAYDIAKLDASELPAGTYIVSVGVISDVRLVVAKYASDGSWISNMTTIGTSAYGDFATITINYNNYAKIGFVWRIPENTQISNVTLYPMLCTKEEWDKSHEYAPYYEPLKDRTLDIADQQTLGAYNLLKNNATTQTLNGVAYTVNADGTVSTNNTASANSTLYIQKSNDSTFALDYALVAGRRAYLSGCPTGGAADKYFIDVYIDNGGGDEHWYRDTGEGAVIDFPAVKPAFIFVYITVRSGQNMTGKVFKPMIALQPNMPYVKWVMTNKELTDAATVKEADITLASGITLAVAGTKAIAKIGHLVMVNFAIKGAVANQNSWLDIGTLPSGYSPASYKTLTGMTSNASDCHLFEVQALSGRIRINDRTRALVATDWLVIFGCYWV